MQKHFLLLLPVLAVLAFLTACQTVPAAQSTGLQVVATTSIVADVVQQIGGDAFTVTTLLPLGSDPHSFQPSPRDMTMVADAKVIFANGAGLEEFLQPLIDNAGATARVVEVSAGIQLLDAPPGESEAGEAHSGDPHTWVDPNNVLVWVENIQAALTELDPANAADYQANAERYKSDLQAMHAWIVEQVATIPPENRVLVTDHQVYGYFAERYGFEQIGAIIPGFSTISSASAKDVAAIESAIQAHKVQAVFVSESTSTTLIQRVSEDTGVALVRLYHGSLSEPGGPADSYINMLRFNINAMVDALKGATQ